MDIDKLDGMLRELFAEGYNSGHEDGVSGNRPTKSAKSTHADILKAAKASEAHFRKSAISDLMAFLQSHGYSFSVRHNGTSELYHDIEHGGHPTIETLVRLIERAGDE